MTRLSTSTWSYHVHSQSTKRFPWWTNQELKGRTNSYFSGDKTHVDGRYISRCSIEKRKKTISHNHETLDLWTICWKLLPCNLQCFLAPIFFLLHPFFAIDILSITLLLLFLLLVVGCWLLLVLLLLLLLLLKLFVSLLLFFFRVLFLASQAS